MPRASGGDGAHDAGPEGMRIGAQLKAARLAARMSMAEVAEQAGLTKGFVSKLERDLVNVSVASLIRLCDALGVSVGSLFQASRGEVVRRGAYPPINFGGRKLSEYLLTPSSEKVPFARSIATSTSPLPRVTAVSSSRTSTRFCSAAVSKADQP